MTDEKIEAVQACLRSLNTACLAAADSGFYLVIDFGDRNSTVGDNEVYQRFIIRSALKRFHIERDGAP